MNSDTIYALNGLWYEGDGYAVNAVIAIFATKKDAKKFNDEHVANNPDYSYLHKTKITKEQLGKKLSLPYDDEL